MNIQIDAQPAVQPSTDVDDTLTVSAGYFVRTDLRAGDSCPCDTSSFGVTGPGCQKTCQNCGF